MVVGCSSWLWVPGCRLSVKLDLRFGNSHMGNLPTYNQENDSPPLRLEKKSEKYQDDE